MYLPINSIQYTTHHTLIRYRFYSVAATAVDNIPLRQTRISTIQELSLT
jgi:hypothetical protein